MKMKAKEFPRFQNHFFLLWWYSRTRETGKKINNKSWKPINFQQFNMYGGSSNNMICLIITQQTFKIQIISQTYSLANFML